LFLTKTSIKLDSAPEYIHADSKIGFRSFVIKVIYVRFSSRKIKCPEVPCSMEACRMIIFYYSYSTSVFDSDLNYRTPSNPRLINRICDVLMHYALTLLCKRKLKFTRVFLTKFNIDLESFCSS